MKKEYLAPEIKVTYVENDIITFSETAKWDGPMIDNEEYTTSPGS